MGVHNLRDFNLCLLASWVKRYQLDNNKIWKKIVDLKYNTANSNILWATGTNASPFWKGVAWAANAARIGYRWQVGDGRTIKFWEDIWFGHCCLATQFWDLYIIANEHNLPISDIWDGAELKISFRRTFNEALMSRWYELEDIIHSIVFSSVPDRPIWMFHPTGIYSVKSFYAVINNGGVTPVHTPALWNIAVPPRIHIFLWLLANNKLLTGDNLLKRRQVDDLMFILQ